MLAQAIRMTKEPGQNKQEFDIVPGERAIELQEHEILVETRQASICDADLRYASGMAWPNDLPPFDWPGHEGGGIVAEVGSKVRKVKPGDRVMLFGLDGCWATHFKSPERNIFLAPDGLSDTAAYLGEPVAVGMYGVFASGVQLGDDVAVAGLNFQGLIAVQGLKAKGARRVIAIDYSEKHLQMAKDLGADVVLNTTKTDAISEVRELTRGVGVDVSYHSCGYWNPRAEEYFNISLEVARDEGIVASVTDIMSPITANLHRAHHHALDVRFPAIMHHGPHFREQWVQRVLRPVVDGTVRIEPLVTAKFPLKEAAKGMDIFKNDEDQVKVLLTV
ncbi:zinc-dependent alcohol dehydrogenase [Enterovirga sp. CN4-39]|uniref:zinc-dependent alcohol dehydrogenase n=1 Tax=Enterovirga sp. CN4-39 TaxID=3400910 RepID=UPI003C050782